MSTATMRYAQQLWEYMAAPRAREACDLVVVCCSYDLRVCDYACELIKTGLAPRLLLSGNTGNWTRYVWDRPEALIFAERAEANGIDRSAVIIEDQATNFGENIAFARALVPDTQRVLFLTKPNSVRRVSLTVPVQWPTARAFVDSPFLRFPDEVSNVIGVFGVIDEMVGDLHRIIAYPRKGFQAPCEVPQNIIAAWRGLIAQGFTHHLLPHEPLDEYTSIM